MSKPTKHQATPLSQVLRSLIKKRRSFEAHINHQEIFLRWGEIAGSHLAQKVVPLEVKGSVLIVGASSSSWAQEVTFFKARILSRIQQEITAKPIRDLRVVVIDPDTMTQASRRVEDPPPKGADANSMPSFLEGKGSPEEDLTSHLLRLQQADGRMKEWRRRQGWPKCTQCGEHVAPDLMTADGDCPICQRENRKDRTQHAHQLLEEMPWLTPEELMRETGLSLHRCSTLQHERLRYWEARVAEGTVSKHPLSDFRRRVMQLVMARYQTSKPPLTAASVTHVFDEQVSARFFADTGRRGGDH